MKLYGSSKKYDHYWTGPPNKDNPYILYNIVPKGQSAPTTGYYSKEYIEQVKGISFEHCNRPKQ